MSSLAVQPLSFTSNNTHNSRSKTEQTAAGVGVAGATTSYASRVANSKGVWSKFGNAGKKIEQLTQEANDALRTVNGNKKTVLGFTEMFKAKRLKYTKSMAKLFNKAKNWKYLGKLVNNPITRKVGAAFSGLMAFFVLVPSVVNMISTAQDVANK